MTGSVPRVLTSKQIVLPGLTVDASWLQQVLNQALVDMHNPRVAIHVTRGGNDPREHDYATITITEGA